MKLKYIFPAIILSVIAGSTYAQYSGDAFRFSQFEQGSTSRIKALGNASTAVGGDLSSISRNPAGLGFFNGSEFSLTPEFNASNIKGTYFGETVTDSKNKLNFNNASVVFNTRPSVPRGSSTTTGLLSLNFGLSWNRTYNFYDNISYQGYNEFNNTSDYLADIANTYSGDLDEYSPERFAADQGLIELGSGNYYVPTSYPDAYQELSQRTSGGQNEFSLAMGANFSNKLYLGLGLGFTSLRYRSFSSLHDIGQLPATDDQGDYDADYESYYETDQHTTGSGFNFRLGLIYKPVEAVRLGATFTSPTWYSLNDRTTYTVDSWYQGEDSWTLSPEADYYQDYNLRTPMKISGGIAVFIQQHGFITADVEYVDYENMHISNTSGASGDNRYIADLYQSTVNARIGAEGRLDNNFYLRAGYGYQGNPQKDISGPTHSVSGGLGYRMSNFYVDATYVNVSRKQHVYPYELASMASPEAELKRSYSNAYLTLGFRF